MSSDGTMQSSSSLRSPCLELSVPAGKAFGMSWKTLFSVVLQSFSSFVICGSSSSSASSSSLSLSHFSSSGSSGRFSDGWLQSKLNKESDWLLDKLFPAESKPFRADRLQSGSDAGPFLLPTLSSAEMLESSWLGSLERLWTLGIFDRTSSASMGHPVWRWAYAVVKNSLLSSRLMESALRPSVVRPTFALSQEAKWRRRRSGCVRR